MKISFYTLGCKVNQYETQVMAQLFKNVGHTVVQNQRDADCVIINSCTVTAESDRKTRQAVRRFKRQLPNGVVVLVGCMPQAFPEKAKELLEADIVSGNTSPEKLPLLLERFLKTRERIVEVENHERNEKYKTPCLTDFSERTRAFMKVQDGCDRYCTYCIIPKARGVIRSKPLEQITAEAKSLAEKGFSEIVLVGINLTSYGKDTGLSVCDAVSAAAKADGIKRIRLGSLEPDHISDEALSRLEAEPKFCPQFHLALQSGSDKTLKRMNRRYDTAFYRDLVSRIRKTFKNPSITTDIMVGFAGESEEEFKENVAFLKEIGFARAHVFAYSKRQGTVAAALDGQVSSAEKEKRAEIMGKAAALCEEEFLKTQVGLTASVLFETYKDGVNEGYTENYTRVKLSSTADLSGKILPVLLASSNKDYCVGKIIDKKDVVEFFDRLAPDWDAEMIKSDQIIGKILDGAKVGENQTVLDVACGTGVLFDYYLERGVKSVTGVDISPKMCGIAKEKFKNEPKVSVLCADIEAEELTEKFDRIVVYNAFPHFPNPEKLIKNLSRMLKTGGILTVAHSMSREEIDRHHSSSASKVSVGLMSETRLKELFTHYLEPYLVISNDQMYQVAGIKK